MRKLKGLEEKTQVESTKKRTVDTKSKPKSILEAFECIVDLVRDSGLRPEFFAEAGPCIRYASKMLGISEMQAVLLSIFVDKSEDTRIRQSEIASYIEVRTVRILQLADEIDGLVAKRYIKSSCRHDDLTYRVPPEVLKALRQNKPYIYEVKPVATTDDFFDRFRRLMKEHDENEISYDELENLTDELLEEIKETEFAKVLKRHDLNDHNRMLFIFMAHLFVENNDDNIGFHDIENLYDDNDIPSFIKRSLRDHRNDLFEKKLIENVNEDGLARSDSFKLTEAAKEEVLGELNLTSIGKSDKGLIKHDSFACKELIYNEAERKLVKELGSILSEERFRGVQSRLRENGLREGFCCLFYGSPGTGKTETVYQLARATGRDIMKVDVDKIKSCWVGESEKNIKGLFDRYRNMCKDRKVNREKIPILLFNEADAVLGVRKEGASSAVDKMENSIQNIILQEMESLEGIMLCTTNLTTNLDTAFERRFLYKVKFEKPSLEARAGIWRAMMPDLKKKDAMYLAGKYDLSGGEIENVVRRHTVNSILSGKEKINLTAIEEACRLERINATTHKKVGF